MTLRQPGHRRQRLLRLAARATPRRRGHDVRVLDLNDADDRPAGVEMMLGDIRDAAVVARAVAGVDVVFNNVAQVPLARTQQLLRTVNVDGTDAAAAAHATRAGVGKVVHTSSSAVFGVPASNPVCRTTVPSPGRGLRPRQARRRVGLPRAPSRSGLDVTIVRPRTILGHGRLGIFGILFDWIADGADIFVLGDGDNRYQFVHADDLAEVCSAGRRCGRPGRLQRRHRSLRHDARVARIAVRPRRHRVAGPVAAGPPGGGADAAPPPPRISRRSPRTTG